MASAPFVDVSQFDVQTITSSSTADVLSSAFDAAVVYNFPADFAEASALDVAYVSESPPVPAQVSSFDVTVVYRGIVDDPRIRAWTFTLDGHDFYVLRLGMKETLVYDVLTEQWYVWGSSNIDLWRVSTGMNWIGGNQLSSEYGSNVLVGSLANGTLYFLDPNKPDDDSIFEDNDAIQFLRKVTGQIPLRGYNKARVYEVQLLGSVSDLDTFAPVDIELFYSDDRGKSYVSAGIVSTAPNDFDIRATWRSLGSFSSPGRLFRIQDFGALKRIDSLTVNTNLGSETQ